MVEPPSPHAQMPSPPPIPNPNLPMLYYALVVIGTAAMVLALYNIIISKWCADPTDTLGTQRPNHGVRLTASRSFSSTRLLSSFKYRKEGAEQDEGNDYECAVCLSVFEEGEELRQLPKCKHSFHVPCIDMWLYSHVECPLCRTPVVEPPVSQC